jgi:hypothetical protein
VQRCFAEVDADASTSKPHNIPIGVARNTGREVGARAGVG